MAAGDAPHAMRSSILKDSVSKRKRANRSAILNLCKQRPEPNIQGKQGLHAHADTHPFSSDPGKVINPKKFTAEHPTVSGRHSSWASVLNSRASTELSRVFTGNQPNTRVSMKSEPDIFFGDLQMKQMKGSVSMNANRVYCNTSPSRSISGAQISDVSLPLNPRSPEEKGTKMGKGPRRSRDISDYRSSKENEALETRRLKGRSKGSPDVRGGHVFQNQGRRHHCGIETEDGWQEAADVLGLHSIHNSSGLLPTPAAYQRYSKSKAIPVTSKVPKSARSCQRANGEAWMQNGSARLSSLPSPSKQREGSLAADNSPQCLICCNDLDSTDTLFQYCPCGFKPCLFCYHRIYSETGKCPACRSVYTRDVSAKPSVNLPR